MAIVPLEQKKKQKILLIVALAILIIAGLVLYFGFWKPEGRVMEEEFLEEEFLQEKKLVIEERTGLVLEERLKKIKLDFTFLTQTMLSFLKSHGDLPVTKGETGRTNPFIPY